MATILSNYHQNPTHHVNPYNDDSMMYILYISLNIKDILFSISSNEINNKLFI